MLQQGGTVSTLVMSRAAQISPIRVCCIRAAEINKSVKRGFSISLGSPPSPAVTSGWSPPVVLKTGVQESGRWGL